MTKLYLLLGGNLGDKKSVFAQARAILENTVGKIAAQSALYETEPWGFDSEDLFWNQVLEISTILSPDEVLQQTQKAELSLGRIRKANQYDSRIIDIDILFYGDRIINQANLIVPHPRIQERKFTLIPLCEIASDLIHPVFQKKIRQLLNECTDPLKVAKVPDFP
ncbi:MAG: 2-amino-4-hydroxy-6-hydroxymethyldihydropteridine diphosphokinase [Prolixibacteraceae bacterium]|nr:2-amino-4-hydroxy-6-hydroxymethyldihydropteridine diphosphokinase [Prolixibacteraceae bacterium]